MRSKLIILKSVVLALGVILFAPPDLVLAAEKPAAKKTYPPYPDVWGREMPIPKDVKGLVRAFNVFEGPDGQILINASYEPSLNTRDGVIFLYDFFSGRVVKEWPHGEKATSAIKALFAFTKANGYRIFINVVTVGSQDKVTLPDGGHFERTRSGLVYDGSIRRFDAAGREQYNWTIIHLSDRAFHFGGNPISEFFGGRSDTRFRALHVFPELYPLRDGTFVLTGYWRPVAVRFRGDLTSPYIQRSGKILLIEPDKVWNMFLESWNEAENILGRLRDQNPKQPWLAPEVTDEIMLSKFKKLINQRRGASK